MINSKYLFRISSALRPSALALIFVSWTPMALAQEIILDNKLKIDVREKEEDKLKEIDPSHDQQVSKLAQQYEKTAKLVASQGGNPKPLLDAAALLKKEIR